MWFYARANTEVCTSHQLWSVIFVQEHHGWNCFSSMILKCYHTLFFQCHLIFDHQPGNTFQHTCSAAPLSCTIKRQPRPLNTDRGYWCGNGDQSKHPFTHEELLVKAWVKLPQGNGHLWHSSCQFHSSSGWCMCIQYVRVSVYACIHWFIHACMQHICSLCALQWILHVHVLDFYCLKPQIMSININHCH